MDDNQAKTSRREILRTSLHLGLCSVALTRPLSAFAASSNIATMEGSVFRNGSQISARDSIFTGDRIQTAPDANIAFSIGDSAFQVRGGTDVEIERIKLYTVGGLRILTGAVLAVFGTGVGRRVTTPTGTIGIRGTGVYCEATDKDTYFCTCYGSTHLQADTYTESVVATHHTARILSIAMGPDGAIVPASQMRHIDGELESLESLVGRTAPWNKPA